MTEISNGHLAWRMRFYRLMMLNVGAVCRKPYTRKRIDICEVMVWPTWRLNKHVMEPTCRSPSTQKPRWWLSLHIANSVLWERGGEFCCNEFQLRTVLLYVLLAGIWTSTDYSNIFCSNTILGQYIIQVNQSCKLSLADFPCTILILSTILAGGLSCLSPVASSVIWIQATVFYSWLQV